MNTERDVFVPKPETYSITSHLWQQSGAVQQWENTLYKLFESKIHPLWYFPTKDKQPLVLHYIQYEHTSQMYNIQHGLRKNKTGRDEAYATAQETLKTHPPLYIIVH